MSRLIQWTLVAIAILSLFRFYTRFKEFAAPIPPGVYLAGLELSALKDSAEMRAHLEQIYMRPVAINYAGERLWLEPSEVDFQVEAEQMVWEGSQYLNGTPFIDIAIREGLGIPQTMRDVPLRFTLSHDKLRAWLAKLATEQDRPPQPSRVTPPIDRWNEGVTVDSDLPAGFVGTYTRDWRWSTGSPGYELDIEASFPTIIEALTKDEERFVDLTLIETSPPLPSVDDLAEALNSYLSNFPGFAAVYIQELETGEVATVDADVSFSGMSTLKIAISAAVMAQIDGLPAGDNRAFEIGQWIDFALGESNNYAANLLIQFLGGGDTNAGTRAFTNFMRELGFENTYMQSGYDAQTQLAQIPTPGNQRDDWSTNPDPNLQSTPREMGEMLTAIYHCTQGKGLLLEIFPDDITPDECEYILFYLGHDQFQELLWSGVPRPEDAWFLHKHGFAFESHSDVAIAWGPTGPYVISVFLYRAGWMDWNTSNDTMKAVSRITWNFFDYRSELLEKEPAPPIELSVPPAYVPVPGA